MKQQRLWDPPASAADNRIVCGDAREELRHFPEQCCDTIVTSPPYFRQRDYDDPRQIGEEKQPDEYVASLVDVFRECKRVLSDRGTLWLKSGRQVF